MNAQLTDSSMKHLSFEDIYLFSKLIIVFEKRKEEMQNLIIENFSKCVNMVDIKAL